jgi:hypothetical protein
MYERPWVFETGQRICFEEQRIDGWLLVEVVFISEQALLNNGYIFANGEDGTPSDKPSGGPGGSILIQVKQISTTSAAPSVGYIKAVGGDAIQNSGSGCGGGRIGVIYHLALLRAGLVLSQEMHRLLSVTVRQYLVYKRSSFIR